MRTIPVDLLDPERDKFVQASVLVARAAYEVRLRSKEYSLAHPAYKREAGERVGEANDRAQKALQWWIDVVKETGADLDG